LYTYDSTSQARSIYDIDKDGMEELHLRRFADSSYQYPGNSYLFFRKSGFDSLAKILSFVFYPFENLTQQNDNKFGDWDGDEFTDQIFHILSYGLYIFEYNPSIQNFDSVYFFDYTSINQEFAGFTIGDFDQDGNVEFFTGSTHGDVLCIENNGNNSYTPTWTGMVETYNAYQLAQTNDVDKNGKKEVWVGGDAFYPGIGPVTRITLFESEGDDSYQVVGRIDLVGVFSFFAQNYQAVDVDKDGIEEMMVWIEQTVLILKFNGSTNHQTYELFYFKQNDLALAGRNSVYYGTVVYDLTNDEREEIIITLDDIIQNVGLRLFSFIYKPEFTIDVDDDGIKHPVEFKLYSNYPNPFNPNTKIRFDLPEYSKVSVKIYNTLGKEIKLLLDNNLPAGEYTTQWDGKDDEGNILPGGVYFIQMTAGKYRQTIKSVLLK
ncbi:MAG: FlgD immunoglobulin-like domain containing protein, partial [Ignavibacteriaceae bacterium]